VWESFASVYQFGRRGELDVVLNFKYKCEAENNLKNTYTSFADLEKAYDPVPPQKL